VISSTEIEQKAAELDVSCQNVERDYVHSWLLKQLFAHPRLGDVLVLKGGSAIRKGYIVGARYSKDLDFSSATEIDEQLLLRELEQVMTAAQLGSGVKFCIDRTRVAEKRLTIPGVKTVEARVYFKGFYANESITLRSHLDIDEFEKTYLPIQSRRLLHDYSDANACTGLIKCQKLEETLASKLTALLFRHKGSDVSNAQMSLVAS
jgi:predicted nucleotidyltransferase component of viral defense system